MIAQFDPDYPTHTETFSLPQHTLGRIVEALRHHRPDLPSSRNLPEHVETAVDLFIGYLMFDAWIGNTDRHHENWAMIDYSLKPHGRYRRVLAPTYDHGSSLGRNESDEKRHLRLTTKDQNQTIKAYANRTPSRIYDSSDTRQPLHPVAAFRAASAYSPQAAQDWLQRLSEISDDTVASIVQAVPDIRMSAVARRFCLTLLSYTRSQLLD